MPSGVVGSGQRGAPSDGPTGHAEMGMETCEPRVGSTPRIAVGSKKGGAPSFDSIADLNRMLGAMDQTQLVG